MKNFICISLVFILLLGLDACCTFVPPAITVTNTQITSPNTGAITVSSGSCPAATGYQWSNGATSPTITGLSANFLPYSVTPTYTLGSNSWSGTPLYPYVLCDVTWVPITTSSPNTVELIPRASGMGAISKSGIGSTAGYNASAYSVNTLPSGQSGLIEFQIGADQIPAPPQSYYSYFPISSSVTQENFTIGFTPQYTADNPLTNTSAISYGLRFTYTYSPVRTSYNRFSHQYHVWWSLSARVYSFINGVSTLISPSYTTGDIFRIIKYGNHILYTKAISNGNSLLGLVNITGNPGSSSSLVVDLAASLVGTNLSYVRTSFGNVIDNDYAELSKTLDGSFYVAHTTLGIRYKEKYNNNTLNYKIYDKQRNIRVSNSIGGSSYTLQNGYNYLQMNLSGSGLSDGYYVLEVTDDKGEIYKLRFQYLQ